MDAITTQCLIAVVVVVYVTVVAACVALPSPHVVVAPGPSVSSSLNSYTSHDAAVRTWS